MEVAQLAFSVLVCVVSAVGGAAGAYAAVSTKLHFHWQAIIRLQDDVRELRQARARG